MKPKADKIEQAMLNVPVEQRGQIFASNSTEALEVQAALATHRHLGKRGNVYYNKGGEIDESKAANSFKNLKQQFFRQRNETERPGKGFDKPKGNKPK